MILISKNLSELVDMIIGHRMHTNAKDYPTEYNTYDEAWEELFLSYEHLRKKLGETRYEQIVDMTKQARKHYDADEIKWGSFLMQDIEQLVRGKPPFAYPEDMYRWCRHHQNQKVKR